MTQSKKQTNERPERYAISAGETEFSVATKFNISVGRLRQANKKFPNPYFKIGRRIFIPQE